MLVVWEKIEIEESIEDALPDNNEKMQQQQEIKSKRDIVVNEDEVQIIMELINID